jgi:hypothetical protein
LVDWGGAPRSRMNGCREEIFGVCHGCILPNKKTGELRPGSRERKRMIGGIPRSAQADWRFRRTAVYASTILIQA